jgi:hypothetical protein
LLGQDIWQGLYDWRWLWGHHSSGCSKHCGRVRGGLGLRLLSQLRFEHAALGILISPEIQSDRPAIGIVLVGNSLLLLSDGLLKALAPR